MKMFFKRVKNFILSIVLCISVVCSGAYGSYQVSAASLVGAYTAFNVWQMILLSLGVTCLAYEAVTHDEAVAELEGNFSTWMTNTGYTDQEEVKESLTDAVNVGALTGTVSLTEKVWDALKDWTADVNGYLRPVDISTEENMSVSTASYTSVTAFADYLCNKFGYNTYSLRSVEAFYDAFVDSGNMVILKGLSHFVNNIEYSYIMFLLLESGQSLVRDDSGLYKTNFGSCSFYALDAYYYPSSGNMSFLSGSTSNLSHILSSYTYDNISLEFVVAPEYSGVLYGSNYSNVLDSAQVTTSVLSRDDYDYVQGLGVGTYDVVTPGRYWDAENEKVRGDVVIPLPGTIGVSDLVSGVIDGTIDYTDALTDIGVYPVDESEEKDLIWGGTIQSILDKIKIDVDDDVGDDVGTGEGSVTVNILTGLFDKVLDALKELADAIISGILGLFVPEDGFIEGQLDALLKKLSELGIAPYDMTPIFSGNNNENPFKDITATIRGHEVVVVSFAHLDMFINRFRPVIRGLMALFLIFYSINQFFSLLRLAGVMEGGHVTTTSTNTSIVPVPGEFSHGVRGSGTAGRIGKKGG